MLCGLFFCNLQKNGSIVHLRVNCEINPMYTLYTHFFFANVNLTVRCYAKTIDRLDRDRDRDRKIDIRKTIHIHMCMHSQLKNKCNKNFQNQFDIFVLNLKMITFYLAITLSLTTLNNMHLFTHSKMNQKKNPIEIVDDNNNNNSSENIHARKNNVDNDDTNNVVKVLYVYKCMDYTGHA